MGDSTDYGAVHRPEDGYLAQRQGTGSADYGGYQNPPSWYAQQEEGRAQTSTLISGLGDGVNLQPSYYHGGNVDLGWALMRQHSKIRTVRIEIEPGQEANAQRWIKEAATNGYTIIATCHKYTVLGSDDQSELLKAAAWWATTYSTLRSAGVFAVNLMNEWGSHGITAHDFASSYNKAIVKVRSVYDGPIIIDIPGYGQEAMTAVDAVRGTANETIADRKIILSMHVYPDAWSSSAHREMTTADIDRLAATGIDCMVGEFGDNRKSGKTDWLKLVTHAKSKGWPVIGWAWDGDGGNMNMISPQFQPFVNGSVQQYAKSGYFDTIYNCL